MNQGKVAADKKIIEVVSPSVSKKPSNEIVNQDGNFSDKKFADDLTKLRNADLGNIKNLITELDSFSNQINSTLQSSGALINNVQNQSTNIRDNIVSGRAEISEAINTNSEGLNIRILKWTGALLALLIVLYLLIQI